MSEPEKLIPSPPVVRNRLARNIQERRLLRALLRLSIRDAENHREYQAYEARPETTPINGGES